VDLVSVPRVEAVMREHSQAEASLFTSGEAEYCRRKRRCFDHFAARLAAKEAVLKAFGTGITQRIRWTDVEVVVERPGGRPVVQLAGRAAAFGRRHGLRQLDLSLSHSGGMALAHALTVWAPESTNASAGAA
jgi:holo-[acyl-carrier protein] synthase